MESKQVFEILMRENAAMLLTYIRTVVGDKSAAEDIFQETMMTAWQKLDDFDRTCAFGPWLRGIAKNHALSHYRKSRRDMLMCNQHILDLLDQQMVRLESQPGDCWSDKIDVLTQCIEQLPDIYREVIDLRYFQELKTADVNAQLDVAKETLKKRLQRAKKSLFSCMQSKGVFVLGEDMA